MAYIYQLVDPRDGLPRYVGYAESLGRRYQQHLRTRYPVSRALGKWFEELHPLPPSIEVLEELDCSPKEAQERETYWIQRLLSEGMPLVNKTGTGKTGTGAEHFRQTIWMPKPLKRRLKLYLAHTDENITSYIIRLIEQDLAKQEKD
jgi:hypothetical protein